MRWYSDYSTACIQNAWPYLYGRFDYGGVRSKAAGQGSYFSQVKNAKLYVTFGNNPAVTRASGGGQSWEFFSAARRNGTRMVFIDPIYSDTMAGRNAEWIPIRPGTDAALCEAIAYVLITENLVDKAFIDRYTIGYDEDSLLRPPSRLRLLPQPTSSARSRQDSEDARARRRHHERARRAHRAPCPRHGRREALLHLAGAGRRNAA